MTQAAGTLAAAVAAAAYVDGRGDRHGPSWASPATISGRLPGADLVALLQNVTENSLILAEKYQRLPSRTSRHDISGQLRPVLLAPQPILQQIAKHTHALEQERFRPGAQVSAGSLDLPVASRRGAALRSLTPDAAAYLKAAGTELARTATSAEQATRRRDRPQRA